MHEYRRLLARADAWYRSAREAHPEKVPCSKGCRDCCLGLFDVTLADRDLLREGLEKADPGTRKDIEARARAVLAKLRKVYPDLKDTLDGGSPDDVDDLCDALGPVECPVLGREGECRLYEHRPLTCRLSGVPLVDVSGETIYAEGCARCTHKPQEAPRLDVDGLRREERKILRRRFPARSGVSVLIPQAVAPGE